MSQLSEQVGLPKFDCKKWKDAFDALTGIIKNGKWIVVFDEFPWMASKKTRLVSLLKYYWDQKWVARRDGVITVIENKFTRQPVGSSIMDEVQSKLDKVDIPKGRTIEKVLVSASGATRTVVDSGYFNRIVTLDELFGISISSSPFS